VLHTCTHLQSFSFAAETRPWAATSPLLRSWSHPFSYGCCSLCLSLALSSAMRFTSTASPSAALREPQRLEARTNEQTNESESSDHFSVRWCFFRSSTRVFGR
jgi:hypothetical protein